MSKRQFTLKELRVSHAKATQEKMAEELGVSLRTYIRYEVNGIPGHARKSVERLASEMGATISPGTP